MRQTRRAAKRASPPPESSDEEPLKKPKLKKTPKKKPQKQASNSDDSSSESDIESYLKPANKINLNSTYFNTIEKPSSSQVEGMDFIEKNIFSGINRLSDSESDSEDDNGDINEANENKEETRASSEANEDAAGTEESAPRLNFQQLQEYTRKIEEAKKYVAMYEARRKIEDKDVDISNILAEGEAKGLNIIDSLDSSDFESLSDSEKEDWEVVKNKEISEKSDRIPKEGVQITLELPNTMRKKKGIDLLTAMKRRLNRVVKENQIYVHQVHLLCWLAHGNYINKILSNESNLGLALSLLPSQNCYPSNRIDLAYLEKLLQWYKKNVKLQEAKKKEHTSFEEDLKNQFNTKIVDTKNMFVYIFICILRSLGVHCRMVLSFQVEPLKPHASQLNSLSTKTESDSNSKRDSKTKIKDGKKTSKSSSSSKTPEGKSLTKTSSSTSKIEDKQKMASGTKTVESKSPNKKSDTNSSDKLDIKAPKKKNDTNRNTSEKNARKESTSSAGGSKTKTSDKKSESKTSSKKIKSTSNKTTPRKSTGKGSTTSVHSSDTKKAPSGSSENRRSKTKDKPSTKETSENSDEKDGAKKDKNKLQLKKHGDDQEMPKNSKTKKPNLFRIKLPLKTSKECKEKSNENVDKVPQNDGIHDSSYVTDSDDEKYWITDYTDSDSDFDLDSSVFELDDDECIKFMIPQLDGPTKKDSSASGAKSTKPNLRKLKLKEADTCPSKTHSQQPKSETKLKDDQQAKPRSPFERKNSASSSPLKTIVAAKVENARNSPSKAGPSKPNLRKLSKSDSSPDKTKVVVSSQGKRQLDVRNDILTLMKNQFLEEKQQARKRLVKNRRHVEDSDEEYYISLKKLKNDESDEDFEEKPKMPKTKIKQRVMWKKEREEIDRRVFSSDSETEGGKKKKKGFDVWAEVYLESEEKWISVDVFRGQIHCVSEIYNRASSPVAYIIAWDNNNFLKDITKRYCSNWNTVTRKLRCNAKWWEKSLRPFEGPKMRRDKEEDEDLARQQLEKPLPTTITEYKNHPLYVLERHLLKFEAIYPSNAVTLGFVRKEPVYSRQCVYTLHSRDIWLKHAKVVKQGEKPYKIVKARPKYDKLSNSMITDQLLEIFGPWQIEDYIPPTAENGVVPRNAYGNVELFKECMLPKGTVHLQLPGLNKVARKMNIDCASAVVGFDFHSGWSHPTYDGFVVCEEFSEQLIAGWYLEQEEAEVRAKEKMEKRVYGNWRKLIRGLLIRRRLQARYDFGPMPGTSADKNSKPPRVVAKKRRICSSSESDDD